MNVSVWVGNASSWEALNAALEFTFNEDGDAIPCPFGEAFYIDWFDEDFREASLSNHPSYSARDLLKRHTRGAEIATELGDACHLSRPCNAVVVLYDFHYTVRVQHAEVGSHLSLMYIGSCNIV